MNIKRTLQLLTITGALCLTTSQLHGQVTIGVGLEPVKGALLDLKEKDSNGDVTATKGLMLPRVNLTNPNMLYPIFTGAYNASEDLKHIGLTVYNLTQCDGKFAQGVYTWTGTAWVQLTRNPILTGNPVLTFPQSLIDDNYLVRIPSGQDLRALTAYAPKITFSGTNQVTGAWAISTTPSTISGGLAFGTNPLFPSDLTASSGATWTTTPINDISIFPEAMAAADLTSNPWLTRESKLTITGIGTGGSCPGGKDRTQEIMLNQTNYAIVPGTVASPTTLLVLHNTSQQSLDILSNVKWSAAEASPTGGTAALTDILGSYTNTPTGSERHDGDKNTNTFNYTSTNPVVQGKRYETARITFSDSENRAKPVTVTVMQCQGTPDMRSVTTNATPAETSLATAPASWAGKVVMHAAKPGVYAEFYSAEFGAAGRWMTTNLAATAYDGITHRAGRTLTGPTLNAGDMADVAIWCYPDGGSAGTDNTAYTNHPHIGYLYTWDAATAGKGGADGLGNIVNERGSNAYARVQGVCPAGWHLPSDYEWTELENAIIRNTTLYANTDRNIDPGDGSAELPYDRITDSYGQTLGSAMKDPCGVKWNWPTLGTSLPAALGGFASLLTGSANSYLSQMSGNEGGYWSSSSQGSEGAWVRSFVDRTPGVWNGGRFRKNAWGVRCKKD